MQEKSGLPKSCWHHQLSIMARQTDTHLRCSHSHDCNLPSTEKHPQQATLTWRLACPAFTHSEDRKRRPKGTGKAAPPARAGSTLRCAAKVQFHFGALTSGRQVAHESYTYLRTARGKGSAHAG